MTIRTITDDVFEQLASSMNLKTVAGKEFFRLAVSQTLLMDAKQQDYGSKNISSFGTFGVIVRMNDKLERIKNLKQLKGSDLEAVKYFRNVVRTLEHEELNMSLLEQITAINDSFQTLRDWFGRKRKKSVNESIQDSFRDLSNYALIAVLLETGKWPNE